MPNNRARPRTLRIFEGRPSYCVFGGTIYGLSDEQIKEFQDQIQRIIDKTPPMGHTGSVDLFRRLFQKP